MNNLQQLTAKNNAEALLQTLIARQNNLALAQTDFENVVKLKGMGDVEVNLEKTHNPIVALAKLGYKAGSLVGLITVLVAAADVLKDMELNTQFLVTGTEDVDMFKLEKVFNCLDKSTDAQGYNRVFNKKQMRRLVDKLGRNQTLVFALKKHIAEFVDQLSKVSALKQSDLVLVGQDLEIIGRVMQELEIDSAKKPEVKNGMLEITDFMNLGATKQASRNIKYTHNFDLVVSKHRGILTEKEAEAVKFDLQLNNHELTMFNIDKAIEKAIAEFYELNDVSTMTDYEVTKSLTEIKKELIDQAVIMDPAGELAKAMSVTAADRIKKYVELYEASNNNLFRGFDIPTERDEDANVFVNETLQQSVFAVQKIAITVYEMINNTFAYGRYTSLRKVEELGMLGRRAIYTAGTRRGFSAEETFEIAINAGWLKLGRRKEDGAEITTEGQFPRFRFKAVEAVFSNELKWRFNEDAMDRELELEFPEFPEGEGIDIEDGIIEFEDGQCEVVIDGESYYIICTNDYDFTGEALIDIDEDDNIRFVEYVDQYEFEELDFILFNELADSTLSTNAFMYGDIEAMKVATTPLKAIDTRNMSEKDKEKAMSSHGQVAERVLGDWSYFSCLPVENKEAGFAYRSKSDYVYVSRQEDGKSRMLGKLATRCLGKATSEYNNAHAVATINGAFLIFE